MLAIVITIMVLELRPPEHASSWSDLAAILPVLLSYVLSFFYVGIYWNNHHHLFHASHQVGAAIMWLIPDRRIECALADILRED